MDQQFYNNIINSFCASEMVVPRPWFQAFNLVKRHWLKRARPDFIEKRKHRNFEFTIASYNILADVLLQDHPHLYQGNNHHNEAWVYDWNYRKANLLEEIKYADADILCLQEVQEEHYHNWFHPKLRDAGYTGLYKKRSGDKEDGCATFFKNNRFEMKSYQFIDFYKENCSFMDRNNVALLVFLQPLSKRNHSCICVSNTHLLFNKKRGDIKLAQLAHLFAEVDRLARDPVDESKYLPLLMCGDFNSTPNSPLYNLICSGRLRYEGLQKNIISGQSEGGRSSFSKPFTKEIFPRDLGLSETCTWNDGVAVFNEQNGSYENIRSTKNPLRGSGTLKHDLHMRSSYLHFSVDGTPEVTTCHERASDTVDYIFHSTDKTRHGEDKGLWLSGVLSLLSDYELKGMGSLPNPHLSSDHLLLMTSFVLPEKS